MEYLGIDVAKWQGVIDWVKVKKAGVKFLMRYNILFMNPHTNLIRRRM